MKLLKLNELEKVLIEQRKHDRKIVFTNGCFDILHRGHINYLQEAKKFGEILIIGMNSDNSIKRIKGKDRPINNQEDRAIVLSALNIVDYITIFEEDTPLNLIKHIKPDILVKGGDWKIGEIVGSDVVLQRGGEVKSLQYLPGYSTSEIIAKIKRNS